MVTRSGYVPHAGRNARRFTTVYFGAWLTRFSLPRELALHLRQPGGLPWSWEKDGRRLSVDVIDRNQKGTLWLRLEEGVIELEQLTRQQRLILHKLRHEHKIYAQIAHDMRMSRATVKKEFEHIRDVLGVHNGLAALTYKEPRRHLDL
jgi:DNA-binding CsgD family transcriptional regulator